MPIYEYKCSKCGKINEAMQRYSDAPLVKCRYCSGKLQKIVSKNSFHLKGTGWYATDYANKSKSNTITSKKKNSDSTSETTKPRPMD
mmetsp:Transcript_1733/g.1190  ORF Transcript_1733/g.1190 Transcript_1733/m.1190 type:complete len:87 (-) Transcript_1733:2112-2372(-)